MVRMSGEHKIPWGIRTFLFDKIEKKCIFYEGENKILY